MQFAAGTFASESLGSVMVDPGGIVDPTSLRPILTEINGVDARDVVAMNTLKIQDTVGQPVTANFTIVNPTTVPVVGDRVRIFYHSQLIFAGTLDHVRKVSPDLRTFRYEVDCLDWSQTLIRRKLRRNFINAPIQNILDSILDNELAAETLTIGTIDSRSTMPLVDSNNGKVFDVLRDIAGATGQTFYVDFDQSIQMRSTSVTAAPLVFNQTNVLMDGMTSQVDRETYRNVQTVIVTGTPPQGQDALETTQQRRNEDQIAERAAIEGGSGLYEEVEEITHPTSNDGVEINLLGISYARLRLSTSGTPRTTVRCQVRGYGFRGGQVATVNLPAFGLVGTYVVQRVSIREVAGRDLFHEIELTASSLQQRAYESWLSIVKGAKVTVQVPGSLTNNLQTFTTPGATTWTVPAGVTTAEFTTYGGSGSAGGKFVYSQVVGHSIKACVGTALGGNGGPSGKALTVLSFDVVVGAAGSPAGTNGGDTLFGCAAGPGTAGVAGTASQVSRLGIVRCQGDAGGGGTAATGSAFSGTPGTDGSVGSGIGDAVSVGGGKIGGINNPASSGVDGLVEVRW
jgi:hypothetical protein